MTLIRPAIVVFALLTALTGLAYPLAFTAFAKVAFPYQAEGSVLRDGGKIVGSELLGQDFTGAKYFWGRPSATSAMPCDGANSAGSNLGPTSPDLKEKLLARAKALKAAHSEQTGPLPVELLTASASGLDPHLGPPGIEYQVPRVAKARGIPEDELRKLVARFTEGPQFGILGVPRVSVL